MANQAQKETDRILEKIEKRLKKEYRKAENEVSEKLADYLRRFEVKDKIKKDQVVRGVITEKEYKDWRTGQMIMGKRWKEMKEVISNDLANADKIARNIIDGEMPEVYALNHNYATYLVEKAGKVDTSYTLYNREAVERIIKKNPKMLPPPGRRMKEKLAAGIEKKWNMERVQSVMLQGILQGESIPQLSKRLYRVTEGNYKAAIRNARTMTTGAENAGHADAYHRAEDMGIKIEQQWLATLDGRTRDSHRALDGEIQGEDGYFSNGLRYPGDPDGDPSETYNCRCRIIANVKGFIRDLSDTSLRHNSKLGNMSYSEWKEEHGTSQSITTQEEVAEGMKWRYIHEEYRK